MSRYPLWLGALIAATAGGCARDAAYHLYWGDVHGHTAYSDGRGSVEEYFTHARDAAGLDFVIVTDHDFGTAPTWLLSDEAWRHTLAAADAFTRDGGFVAIAGYEWTSAPGSWAGPEGGLESVRFPGPRMDYNHKNVYFPGRPGSIFPAHEPAYSTPDLLADAVRAQRGLIHNNHPAVPPVGKDQWAYEERNSDVIANTEMNPDVLVHKGTRYEVGTERVIREFLRSGGRTGFVGASDTHEGTPAARTGVWARALTREGVFEALRARRNYAIHGTPFELDFRVNGLAMGGEAEIAAPPRLTVRVRGPAPVAEIVFVRDGEEVHRVGPGSARMRAEFVDHDAPDACSYYVRVTLADADKYGNPSQAWASPVWVRRASKRR